MKNKGLILTIISLTSLLNVGCDNSIPKDEPNSEQALYNRIILDYYEQRVANERYVTSVYEDFPYSSRFYNQSSPLKTIDHVIIDAILGSTTKNAYFVATSMFYNQSSHINHYENCKELNSFYADGKQVYYPRNQNFPFDVWCNGTIYYPLDAVYSGVITLDELLNVSISDAKTALEPWHWISTISSPVKEWGALKYRTSAWSSGSFVL